MVERGASRVDVSTLEATSDCAISIWYPYTPTKMTRTESHANTNPTWRPPEFKRTTPGPRQTLQSFVATNFPTPSL